MPKIPTEKFHFVSMYNWEDIYQKVLSNFADWKWIRQNKSLHWLNVNGILAKDVVVRYSFDSRDQWDWILKLPDLIGDNIVYLLIEEVSKFWVAQGDPTTIAQILHEGLYDLDYYIVDRKYQWMITCNHHQMILFMQKGYANKTAYEGCNE